MNRRLSSLAIGLCLTSACAPAEPWALSERSATGAFTSDVYPVLLRDCAFFACHGSPERLFRIWGPKRRRLYGEATLDSNDAERQRVDMEIQKTFQNAISFVDINEPERSMLLRKGLDSQAGGTGHLGLDKFGRNVYRSADSPGYVELSRWVFSLRPDAAQ